MVTSRLQSKLNGFIFLNITAKKVQTSQGSSENRLCISKPSLVALMFEIFWKNSDELCYSFIYFVQCHFVKHPLRCSVLSCDSDLPPAWQIMSGDCMSQFRRGFLSPVAAGHRLHLWTSSRAQRRAHIFIYFPAALFVKNLCTFSLNARTLIHFFLHWRLKT